MRVFFLGNNRLACQVLEWLRANDEQIVGLAVHPPDKARMSKELIDTSGLCASEVFDGSTLEQPHVISAINSLDADIAISVLFGYILRPTFLDSFRMGCINLHPSYLPYNRGAFPNVWSIIERTPAGVTLHKLDSGVDTGAIIAQRQVLVEPVDTGQTLYNKLEKAALVLFKDAWPQIRIGMQTTPQDKGVGTSHCIKDVNNVDHIDLNRTYSAGELIDIIRARTYPPYQGAYFIANNGRKVYLRLVLEYGD